MGRQLSKDRPQAIPQSLHLFDKLYGTRNCGLK
jgi:hypothetical protein